jgi:hypothetical protein
MSDLGWLRVGYEELDDSDNCRGGIGFDQPPTSSSLGGHRLGAPVWVGAATRLYQRATDAPSATPPRGIRAIGLNPKIHRYASQRPTPPTSPQRTIGCATLTSSADQTALHLRHPAHNPPRL